MNMPKHTSCVGGGFITPKDGVLINEGDLVFSCGCLPDDAVEKMQWFHASVWCLETIRSVDDATGKEVKSSWIGLCPVCVLAHDICRKAAGNFSDHLRTVKGSCFAWPVGALKMVNYRVD